jgi:5-methylcytosine-specific restriction endonuclease McrBC GTP-binding regulatory subunit McrB
MIPAETGPRAGSPTREYQPGPKFGAVGPAPEPVLGEAPGAQAILIDDGPSVAELLVTLQQVFQSRGFIVSVEQLANFYLALKSSHLVILAGRSGTGKSLLPRLFAEYVGAHYKLIPVQPQWSDNADLLGYTPTLNPTEFFRGRLTKMIEEAAAGDQLGLATLDEMNLAPVEHYFSDFLSVLESRRRVGGDFTTDSLPLELPARPESGPDPYESLRELGIPANFRLVGTANVDETTRPFSARVLDRAFSIEFDEVDLAAFAEETAPEQVPDFGPLASRIGDPANPVGVTEALSEARPLFEAVGGLLSELNQILAEADLGFAYRTRDAICLFLFHLQKDGLETILPIDVAFDLCILQKVLPRVHGQGSLLHATLDRTIEWLEDEDPKASGPLGKTPYTRSAAKVRGMKRRLEQDGATEFWKG